MHPKHHWVNDEEEASIAQSHLKLNAVTTEALERAIASGQFPQAEIISSIHHRMLWWETYITRGALDEQISDRVRDEAKHFWNALREATLKLDALAALSARVDAKLRALDQALDLTDVQRLVIDDAVPPEYKLRLTRVAQAVKQALAA